MKIALHSNLNNIPLDVNFCGDRTFDVCIIIGDVMTEDIHMLPAMTRYRMALQYKTDSKQQELPDFILSNSTIQKHGDFVLVFVPMYGDRVKSITSCLQRITDVYGAESIAKTVLLLPEIPSSEIVEHTKGILAYVVPDDTWYAGVKIEAVAGVPVFCNNASHKGYNPRYILDLEIL